MANPLPLFNPGMVPSAEPTVDGVWLDAIGYSHYFLSRDNRLYDPFRNIWHYPHGNPPNEEFVLWDITGTTRTRFKSQQLWRYMFDSPKTHWAPGFWLNAGAVGFSQYELTWGGEIYSLHLCQYIAGGLSDDGYVKVCIRDDFGNTKTVSLHRLIAQAFIPNTENKPEVNHLNGNKQDNCVRNLEWAHGWENVEHALKNGLRQQALTDEMIHLICKLLEEGIPVMEIAARLSLPKHAVLGIKSGCHARISQNYNIPKNKHF